MKKHLIPHLSQFPCPICGGSDFRWGEAMPRQFGFLDENSTWLAAFSPADNIPTSRLCANCGNLQLFDTKTAEEGSDRARGNSKQ